MLYSKSTISTTVINCTTILFLIFCLSSCSGDKEVLIYNSGLDGQSVLIDGKEIKLDSTTSFTSVRLPVGTHTIESGGVLPESIDVKGHCLVATKDTEFVLFPVVYESEAATKSKKNNDYAGLSITMPKSPIIIGDSMVIYHGAENQKSLIRNMGFFTNTFGKHSSALNKSNLRILKPEGNVYPKSWNYSLDNIPDELMLRGKERDEKSAVADFGMFRILCMLDPEFKYEKIESTGKLDTIKNFNKVVYNIE